VTAQQSTVAIDTAVPATLATAPVATTTATTLVGSAVPLSTAAGPATTLAAPVTTQPGVVSDLPAVDAKAYVVFDATAGVQLAASNETEPLAVGSIQKLLTAYVVAQAGDPDKIVTVPKLQVDAKESQIGLYAGEQLSRAVLMRAMLIVSANDAARALAIDVAGSEEAFVAAMNSAAVSLGLTDTVAANSIGLDDGGGHSSAADVLTLARTMMADDTFRATVARPTATLHGMTYKSSNPLLGTYDGADGIKTGHTTDAGYCLAASATREGRTIYVVVLGASTNAARTKSATALLDWAFTHPAP
jgi:D-alanyl-D-alanine carboxypeptidase (penicillin-binding protein 5/6)